jgi:hypothetical protein
VAEDEGTTNAEATPRRADAPSVADTRNMLAANGLILMVEGCVGLVGIHPIILQYAVERNKQEPSERPGLTHTSRRPDEARAL